MGRTMTRKDNWRKEFETVIDDLKAEPFRWGSDCLFGLVVPILNAISDDGPRFTAYAGRYKTAKGALGVMRRSGFQNLADLAASELPEIHPSQCRVGDIAAIPTDDDFGFSLGVVNGDRVFVKLEHGLGTRDLMEAKRAFQVI